MSELEDLKQHVRNEKEIINSMISIESELNSPHGKERDFYIKSYSALESQLRLLNNAIPRLLQGISSVKKLDSSNTEENKTKPKNIAKFSYVSPVSKEKKYVTINNEDKSKYLKELSISESNLKRFKKTQDKKLGVRKVNPIARFSNKIFLGLSEKIAPKIKDLKEDMRKANITMLPATYISIAMFSACVGFILSLLVVVVLGILNPSYFLWFWIPFLIPGVILIGFYVFPALQKGSVKKNINYELPFATIHMAAISSSDIEPTKIFKIISMSEEYPNIAVEIRKIVTQVEIYGYDLVSALKSIASQTTSKGLGELLRGMATNISTGGSLKNYLNKKAENLLMDYKLDRQRYSALSETFMDIYISILIAAPLVLMMLFIIMSVSGWGLNIGLSSLLFLTISGVVFVNIIFLIVMQIKQPKT